MIDIKSDFVDPNHESLQFIESAEGYWSGNAKAERAIFDTTLCDPIPNLDQIEDDGKELFEDLKDEWPFEELYSDHIWLNSNYVSNKVPDVEEWPKFDIFAKIFNENPKEEIKEEIKS